MSAPTTALRLVSWNVHGTPTSSERDARIARIAGLLAARQPDVALLQEVWRQSDADVFRAVLEPAGYTSVEVPGTRRWPTRTAGLLGFVRSAAGWQAEEVRFHEYGAEAPAWKLWQGDGFGDKGALGFTLRQGGLALGVWNTHLQAAYEGDPYTEVRRQQLAELRLAVAGGDGPALVAGDLNTRPSEAVFGELAGLRELTAALRAECGCGTSAHPGADGEWIDYVLAREAPGWRIEAEVQLLRNRAVDDPWSDHHGLDARIALTPPAAGASLRALAAARLAAPTTRRELLASAALWLAGG